MPSAFPGSPRVLKGALVVFETPAPVPTNIIAFQYNRDDPVAVVGQTTGQKVEQDDTWYKTHRGWISGTHVQVTGNVPLVTP